MSIEVIVNGNSFRLFKQVDVSRSLDDFLADARLTVSEQVANQSFIKAQDSIQIRFDSIPVMTGFVDSITDSETNEAHDISHRLRDVTSDIVDSTVPENVKALENVTTLKALCELVIDGLGLQIEVIDEAGVVFDGALKAAETGQKAGDFLQEYARKAQAFLGTDGLGRLIIRRPSGVLATQLVSVPNFPRNNIENASLEIDYTERFNHYIVRSNGDAKQGEIDNSGEAFDNDIRTTRRFEKIAESPMTAAECTRAAEEEANIRRIRSWGYKCQIAGASSNGQVWEAGRIASVKDTVRSVVGEFLIRSVTLTASGQGEIASLNMTYPDAYRPKAELTAVEERAVTAAPIYTVVAGDTLANIAARHGVPLSEVIAANPQIDDPELIFPGGEIKIPSESVT